MRSEQEPCLCWNLTIKLQQGEVENVTGGTLDRTVEPFRVLGHPRCRYHVLLHPLGLLSVTGHHPPPPSYRAGFPHIGLGEVCFVFMGAVPLLPLVEAGIRGPKRISVAVGILLGYFHPSVLIRVLPVLLWTETIEVAEHSSFSGCPCLLSNPHIDIFAVCECVQESGVLRPPGSYA